MTKAQLQKLETRRRALQVLLDDQKTPAERNEMGQFSTPPALADALVSAALRMLGNGPVRFLDPAIGTGVFFSSLNRKRGRRRIESALGFDIDPHYGAPAAELWASTGLDYRIADFTKTPPERRFNLLVANPPYVRHHHLAGDEKLRLAVAARSVGVRLSGLAGLYCYFLLLSSLWMERNGISAWLIPSEFMDVNYGHDVRHFLLRSVTLVRIHRFDPNDVQFGDALVSSAVVFVRHNISTGEHQVRFTYGGTIAAPAIEKLVPTSTLLQEHKWSRFPALNERDNAHLLPRLRDYFHVKRGLATGANDTFILTHEQAASAGIPPRMLRPILPSPRHLSEDVVEADGDGDPLLARKLYLLDCNLAPDKLKKRFPRVWEYLEKHRALLDGAYLLKHRGETWYRQENRPAAPILCTYMGRSDGDTANPFRFILNKSNATAANSYHCLYPKGDWALHADPELYRHIWDALRNVDAATMLGEGRVYGGGLHKVEPKELANIAVPALAEIIG